MGAIKISRWLFINVSVSAQVLEEVLLWGDPIAPAIDACATESGESYKAFKITMWE